MGSLDAYQVEFLEPWDVAAGSLIVTEAGGAVIDIDGNIIFLIFKHDLKFHNEIMIKSLHE